MDMPRTKVSFERPVWFSQLRDLVVNDNMSAAMQMRMAADLERWAASRANEPAFAAMCFRAVTVAQEVRAEHKPRAV